MTITCTWKGGIIITARKSNRHFGAFFANRWFGFARTPGTCTFCLTAFHFAIFHCAPSRIRRTA